MRPGAKGQPGLKVTPQPRNTRGRRPHRRAEPIRTAPSLQPLATPSTEGLRREQPPFGLRHEGLLASIPLAPQELHPHTHPVLSAFQGRNSPNRPPRAAVQFLLRFTETLSPNTEPFWHPLLAASASEPALTQPQGTEPSRELGRDGGGK